uniref:Peptidase S1 domain-containing protein n=1 Tax=Timema bartmani TaxID=61472 RepID=A0A7R9I1V9_9NEOP|nr:unnamed protein product [Timema bartmani]
MVPGAMLFDAWAFPCSINFNLLPNDRDGVEKRILESNEIYVRVGSTKWNHGGQIYDVDDRLRHQKYVTYGVKDIAIIKIKGEFSFSDTVKIIPIAQRTKVLSKGEVTLAGWGRIQYNIEMKLN